MASKTHGSTIDTETDTKTEAPEPTLVSILARMAEIQAEAQAVQKAQLKQTAKKSNEVGPDRSPYNPRGEKDFPMPILKCDVFAPWKMSPTYHPLDREEVELTNLLEPGDYLIELTDGSMCPLTVLGIKNQDGSLESMRFVGAKDEQGQYAGLFTNENKQNFPAYRAMLREMVGEAADAVMTMKKEQNLIKSGELSVSQGE